jgi:hypothetical protein
MTFPRYLCLDIAKRELIVGERNEWRVRCFHCCFINGWLAAGITEVRFPLGVARLYHHVHTWAGSNAASGPLGTRSHLSDRETEWFRVWQWFVNCGPRGRQVVPRTTRILIASQWTLFLQPSLGFLFDPRLSLWLIKCEFVDDGYWVHIQCTLDSSNPDCLWFPFDQVVATSRPFLYKWHSIRLKFVFLCEQATFGI